MFNPLYRQKESIHAWATKLTPPGSDEQKLTDTATRCGWKLDTPYILNPDNDKVQSEFSSPRDYKVIKAYLGGYKLIFHADVIGRWYYNEAGKLVKIEIEKHVDAL